MNKMRRRYDREFKISVMAELESGKPAMVEVVRPKPGETIYDPACGTGGFPPAAHDYIEKSYSLDKIQKRFLKFRTFFGEDIVDGPGTGCEP